MRTQIPLKVSDLKQFAYCPRIVYYQYIMPVDKKTTFKMEYGKMEEERIDRLEERRGLRRYGLGAGKRYFHYFLHSARLGLSGKIDMLIETESELFPVDFKYTAERPHLNHIYQICGYALIIDDVCAKPVRKGFVYLIPQEEAVEFEITDALKYDTGVMLNAIRDMISSERMPGVVDNRNKCYDCEYRNYCGDVF